MNFLTPLFLIGGLAIAGPIIFHLIKRTTRERTLFSSLMFLLPTPPRLSKRSRLEHLLLLLLRCLALGLLALGFSRPFFKQAPLDDPTAVQPKRIVVLVDVSASMRRTGLWAAARERVEATLGKVSAVDHVALYTFDRAATPLLPFEEWNRTPATDRAALAKARLAAVSPGWSGTQLGTALMTAAEALAESDGKQFPGPRQIVLVSDLQAGSRIDALQAYEWPKTVTLTVETVKASKPTNAGLQLVADSADTSGAAETVVRVRVSNSADAQREQFKLGWTRASATGEFAFVGKPIDVYVPPGQSRVIAVPIAKDAPGLERIELKGDDEDFDNVVSVIPPGQQRLNVLWLGNDAPEDIRQPLFFLRRALSDTPRLGVSVVARNSTEQLLPDDIATASVVFVTDALPAAQTAALREQALAGKTLVFAPKSAASAATLGALVGREGVALTEARPTNYAMFAEIDFKHPLFASFADPRFSDFTKIHIWKYRKLDAAAIPDARVLARFDSGDPAVIEAAIGKGRLFVLTTGWQPDDSQLAVSTKFVPLLWSLLELGGGGAAAPAQWFVGDTAPLPPGAAGTAKLEKAEKDVRFTEPGLREIKVGERVMRFAVNLDPNESRTAPLAADELERLGVPLTKAEAKPVVTGDSKIVLQGIEAENRQKLWRWFIAATLAVLLVESALAGWTARKENSKQTEAAT
jgi:GNAT superfamily N-acetyltransferase